VPDLPQPNGKAFIDQAVIDKFAELDP